MKNPPTPSGARRAPGAQIWPAGVLLALLAFVLRVYRLDAVSLRGDESFTALFVAYPLPQLWDGIRNIEPNPPLYYLLLRGAMALWGRSEFALRYFSATFGVLAVPLVYQLGRLLCPETKGRAGLGTRAGLLAAALLAVDPYQVWHSQDVRNYTLWPALSLLSLVLLLRALRGERWRSWAVYLVAALASLYTHYYEVFVLLAANAYVLLAHWRERRLLKRWLVVQLLLAALYLPWPLFFSSRPLTYVMDPTAVPGPLRAIWQSVRVFAVGETLPGWPAAVSTAAALALLAVGLACAWRREMRTGLFVSLYLALPALCLYLLTFWRPLFRVRYFNVIAPGCYLVLAWGLMGLARLRRGRLIASAALALLVAPMLLSLGNYYWNPRYAKSPDWRGLAAYLDQQVLAEDVIVQNYPDPGLAYYYRGSALRIVLPDRPAVDQAGDLPVDRAATGERLTQLLAERRQLWLLPQESSWDRGAFVAGWLERRAAKVYEGEVAGFRLVAYRRAEAPAPSVPVPQQAALGESIRLLGYGLEPSPGCGASPGAALRIADPASCVVHLTLYWQSLGAPEVNYTVFVHLSDEAGQPRAQQDGQPQGGRFPTGEWLPGDVIVDARELALSPEIQPGSYHLTVGLYRLENGERLPAYDGQGQRWAHDAIQLDAPIEVLP